MKVSFRDLLLVTAILAQGSGCMVEVQDDDVQYFPPGPEFQRSGGDEVAPGADLPGASPPAPNQSEP